MPQCVNKAMVLQDPYLWTGSDVRIREPDMPNIHFAVAFKGASWSDPDSVALMVMQVTPLSDCCYHHAAPKNAACHGTYLCTVCHAFDRIYPNF